MYFSVCFTVAHPVAYLVGRINTLQGRLMRHLSAMGYLIEIGADEYRLTNYTRAMSIPVIGNGYLAM